MNEYLIFLILLSFRRSCALYQVSSFPAHFRRLMVLPHDKNEIVNKLINTKEKDRDSILRPLAPQAVMKTATPRRPLASFYFINLFFLTHESHKRMTL